MVELRSLNRVYQRGQQRIEVLHHIDLDVAQGEFVALMGPSGSGKTALLNVIGGLDSQTEGRLVVAGERICQLGQGTLARWRAAHVGFVVSVRRRPVDFSLPFAEAVQSWGSCWPAHGARRRLISGRTSSITASSTMVLTGAASRRSSSCAVVSPSRPTSATRTFLP